MSEGLIVFALVVAVLIGVGAAAFLVMRTPAFWLDFGQQLVQRLTPEIIKYLSKPLTPEDQKKLDAARRRAEEWDNFKKKPRERG
jgi:hypothetical protein